MTRKEILHSIFVEYFGDKNVDFKEDEGLSTILIYFPKVTVTNENDKSIEITKLFVKVVVDEDCQLIGTFTMNRAEYTADQFRSNYMHSHIRNIPARVGNYEEFASPCLGTGPLRHTCTTLNNEFSEDFWRLFCFELSLYVTRESLVGIPYRNLESIGVKNSRWDLVTLNWIYSTEESSADYGEAINNFIYYLLSDMPFEFNYVNGSYGVAMSPFEWVIAVSNKFIEWYNEQDRDFRSCYPYTTYMDITKIEGFSIYRQVDSNNTSTADLNQYIGKPICTFKGEKITLSITDIYDIAIDENTTLMLRSSLCNYILSQILKIINFGYGHYRKSRNSSRSSSFTTPISETVLFI